jgi:hypothetical protein
MPIEAVEDEVAGQDPAVESGDFEGEDVPVLEGVEDSGAAGEGSREPEAGSGEVTVPPASPGPTALDQRIEALQRSVTALSNRLAGLPAEGGAQPGQAAPFDPNRIRTLDDLFQALNQQFAALQGHTTVQAQMAAGEARARGLFTADAVGEGFDYDSIKAKHIDHLVQADPTFGHLLSKQSDPALATYFLGLLGEIMERAGNDPVKTAKAILSGLGAEVRGAKSVKKAIDMATRRGVQKILGGKGSAARSGPTKLTAESVWAISDEAFDKADAAIEDRIMGG